MIISIGKTGLKYMLGISQRADTHKNIITNTNGAEDIAHARVLGCRLNATSKMNTRGMKM